MHEPAAGVGGEVAPRRAAASHVTLLRSYRKRLKREARLPCEAGSGAASPGREADVTGSGQRMATQRVAVEGAAAPRVAVSGGQRVAAKERDSRVAASMPPRRVRPMPPMSMRARMRRWVR
ncbi:hypothetical protein Axi01nite_06840 [Actinoplanes xinjiangensis]|nr:hypothetical protein Axi01nite_06840 [Actinoplanes xinjiangensis]